MREPVKIGFIHSVGSRVTLTKNKEDFLNELIWKKIYIVTWKKQGAQQCITLIRTLSPQERKRPPRHGRRSHRSRWLGTGRVPSHPAGTWKMYSWVFGIIPQQEVKDPAPKVAIMRTKPSQSRAASGKNQTQPSETSCYHMSIYYISVKSNEWGSLESWVEEA